MKRSVGPCVSRTIVLFGTGVLLLIALNRWCERGWIRTFRVGQESMAPNFLGDHFQAQCTRCRRRSSVAPFDLNAVDRRATCRWCGSVYEIDRPVRLADGDRVLIDTMSAGQRPSRWQVVALRHPRNADEWVIKRIVGLPGESIQLRGGDLFVNGRRQAKSLAQLRDMAIPLLSADSPVDPFDFAWSRWRADAAWRLHPSGFRVDLGPESRWSWLSFQGCELAGRSDSTSLILDDLPYNVMISRRLFPIRDVLLSVSLAGKPLGSFVTRLQWADHGMRVRWDRPGRTVSLNVDGQTVTRRRLPFAQTDRRSRLDLALCDGRVHFALNGTKILDQALSESLLGTGDGIAQLQIGTDAGPAFVTRIELFRDVYYYVGEYEQPSGGASEWQLEEGELFVLGDNPPLSVDSRQLGPVPLADLIGTVRHRPKWGR